MNTAPANIFYDSSIDPRYLFASNPYGNSHLMPSPSRSPAAPHSFFGAPASPSRAWSPYTTPSPNSSSHSHSSSSSSCHSYAPSPLHYVETHQPTQIVARRPSAAKQAKLRSKLASLDDLANDTHPDGRPTYSVKTLCEYAIRGSKDGKLSLGDIVEACARRFPFFDDEDQRKKFRYVGLIVHGGSRRENLSPMLYSQ